MSGFVLENEKEIGALNYDGFINCMSLESCFCSIIQTKWIIFFNQFIYIICWFRFVRVYYIKCRNHAEFNTQLVENSWEQPEWLCILSLYLPVLMRRLKDFFSYLKDNFQSQFHQLATLELFKLTTKTKNFVWLYYNVIKQKNYIPKN